MIDTVYYKMIQWSTWIAEQDEPAFFVSLTALIVAIIALSYTVRTFWLKAGDKVRFSYSIHSNIEAEDKYIGSITLENLKDKALVIFEIYLKIGNGLYLEIEKFESAPLIVRPFEVYQKAFDPVIFYSSNTDRVKIDRLLEDRRIKRYVVLSTTNGKYRVKANIPRWTPLGEYFGNVYSGIIQPRWLIHRGKAYGSQVRFLLDIEKHNGSRECVTIYPEEYRHNQLRNLKLTKDLLETKESFDSFVREKLADGTINWKSYEIIEFRKEVQEIEGFLDEDPIIPEPVGLFRYHTAGRLLRVVEDIKMWQSNRRLAKQRKRSASK